MEYKWYMVKMLLFLNTQSYATITPSLVKLS
jgi:hypothetical protein